MTPVLVHGDFGTNNLMWAKTADGTPSSNLTAVIDWQMAHAGTHSSILKSIVLNSILGYRLCLRGHCPISCDLRRWRRSQKMGGHLTGAVLRQAERAVAEQRNCDALQHRAGVYYIH